MISLVAILGLPASSWAQFKAPVRTDIGLNADSSLSAAFSGDMLDVVWSADLHLDNVMVWDIWWSSRDSIDSPWEDPEPLDIVNTSGVDNSPYLSNDGLTLTFTSNGRQGGHGGLDMWQSTRASREDPWQEPVNMGPTINTPGHDGTATFSPDGLEIIFNEGCATGPGCPPSTLRRSTRESLDGEWTTPEQMTPSERGDQLGAVHSPTLSADGLSLYFTALGEFGRDDVFVARRTSLDAPFGEPENLGTTINSSRRDVAPRIAPDGSLYYGYNWSGTSGLRIWRAEPETIAELLGDFDNNGVLDIADIDDLMSRVAAEENHTTYDLNNDAAVNTEDIRVWVKDLASTWFGDANLDGKFNSSDMVDVFQAGNYELDMEAGWAEGDWNGDRRFDSGDMVAAFQDGGYELGGTRAAVSAVPEPSYAILLGIGMIGLCPLRKRR